MSIASWLGTLAGPLAKRALMSIGMGTVTFAGASVALNTALTAAKTAIGQVNGDVLNLLSMAGFLTAMSVIAGALIAGLSFTTLKKMALHTTGAK